MRVLPKKRPPYEKGQTPKPPAQAFTFPAPIRGLVLNESIASPGPAGALVLDNWICTTTGIKARGGTLAHATLPGPVEALMPYRNGASELLFAATSTGIYNVSDTSSAPEVVGSRTSGAYSSAQFGTAGTDFLCAVNGSDPALLFDGSAWSAVTDSSDISITGVDTSALSHVWSFANRLFFVEGGTLRAWYLPVDSVGGAANSFSLAGIFNQGGALLFGATWSLDAGDGLDDKCVFVSTEGEVAIYSGTNPGDAANWRLDGVYRLGRPLGAQGTMQAGGDLLVATENGLVPLSSAIRNDIAALEMTSVSAAITPLWEKQVDNLPNGGWQIVKWPSKNVAIISQPGDNTALVVNLQTKAWSRFTGLDMRCLGFFDRSVFFGAGDGTVYRMEATGSDDGAPYTAVYLGQHDGLGAPGQQKTVWQARPTFRSSTAISPQVGMQFDYRDTLKSAPSAVAEDLEAAVWDQARWDQARWDSGGNLSVRDFWISIGVTGYTLAPEVQVTFGNLAAPAVEYVGMDVTYTAGSLVA